ncbi:MAG: TusE/DsrC/DsvC family sulfur relay protein [Rhodocyclaceae bacterium]|nr:TusE/DsrC/DsvC family sulfur relay protein [Rhodocyclaceae bacterium]
MLDINKFIVHADWLERDPDGHFADMPHWSPKVAQERAEREGIVLTEAHWEAIAWLREHYRRTGPQWRAKEVTRAFAQAYDEQGGLRYLYTLFPRGPLTQGCQLAGLPLPHGALDPSFGSVH